MSDALPTGVLYTNHVPRRTGTPLLSVWSYVTQPREADRLPVVTNAAGEREFWLDHSDPLLNSILPSTAVQVVQNFGGEWASGPSLVATSLVPRACVIGPFTRPRILRVGRDVRAIGVALSISMASRVLSIAPASLVDRIVPLDELWPDASEAATTDIPSALDALIGKILRRAGSTDSNDYVVHDAIDAMTRQKGMVSIDALAEAAGMSRQQLARRFRQATGMPPKVFARLTRFQALIPALLVSEVSRWAGVATELGFTDQAHMINEFRQLAGQSPTHFFRPHDESIAADRVKVRGRPSEWLRQP